MPCFRRSPRLLCRRSASILQTQLQALRLFKRSSLCVSCAACACHHMHVVVRGQLWRVSSLLRRGFCSSHLGWLLPCRALTLQQSCPGFLSIGVPTCTAMPSISSTPLSLKFLVVVARIHLLGLLDSEVCRACAFLDMICRCLLLDSDTPKTRLVVTLASRVGLPRMGVPALGYPLASPFSCFDAGSAKPGDSGMMS